MSFFNLISTGGLTLAASLAVSTVAFAASPTGCTGSRAGGRGLGRLTIRLPSLPASTRSRHITFDVYIDETVSSVLCR